MPGEVVAVIGPNGAGKSTLLAALSGAVQPAAGQISIDDADLSRMAPEILALHRAVLEQTPAKDLAFTVGMLAELTVPIAVAPPETGKIVERALKAVDLYDMRTTPVSRLSGGQAHRAHLARTLAQLWGGQSLGHGRYLLIDEPTASLDLQHQRGVLDVVRDASRAGAGVLIILHDLTLAASAADRIILMREGRIAAQGSPDTVIRSDLIAPVYGTPVIVLESGGQMVVAPDFQEPVVSGSKAL